MFVFTGNMLLIMLLLILTAGITISMASSAGNLFQDFNPEMYQLSVISSNFIPTATAQNISRNCLDDSHHYVKALRNQSQWALSSKSCYYLSFFKIKTTLKSIFVRSVSLFRRLTGCISWENGRWRRTLRSWIV